MTRRQIAIAGAGVAGLTAAYILQQQADVTLFETSTTLGGHADTHEIVDSSGRTQYIDTGFIVHNESTYPTLLRLFRELGVETQPSEMSMSISCGGCGLEYAGGRGITGLIPTMGVLRRPRYVRLLTEVTRFHRAAKRLLASDDSETTLRQFLDQKKFSLYFTAHFVTPLVSAVWSCAPDIAGDYPARYLFTFLANHGMLSVTGSPQWRTVVGGSHRYVEKIAKTLTAVATSTPVREVRRTATGVQVRDGDDVVRDFDAIVIATHPRHALAMLADPTPDQQRVLSQLTYTVNPTQLHTDLSVLPRARRAQASWNYYLPNCDAVADSVNVSYNMNRLQRLDSEETFVVTLNPGQRVAPHSVLAEMNYEHPVFTLDSVAASRELAMLSDSTLAFAGAYHGWGFHEDGARSGAAAAAALGVQW